MKTTETKPPMWAVMKMHGWRDVVVNGYPLSQPKEGPHGLIPVFKTREQAVEWAGSEENVRQLELKTK